MRKNKQSTYSELKITIIQPPAQYRARVAARLRSLVSRAATRARRCAGGAPLKGSDIQWLPI